MAVIKQILRGFVGLLFCLLLLASLSFPIICFGLGHYILGALTSLPWLCGLCYLIGEDNSNDAW